MKISITLIILFFSALGFSLAFTPMVRAWGIRFGAMDIPLERNVHTKPIPRIGGLAVFLSFAITLFLSNTFLPHVSKLYVFNFNIAMGYMGAFVVLGCGLWDDFHHLKPWTKLFFQIAAATLAFVGGAKITGMSFGSYGIQFNFIISYAVTIFWFLLFVNAVNLIDGLDGLAGGLIFFTCVVMVISSYINHDYLSAFYFSILGGAVLGFLRYNFNPATVFMGDGGSYFLGYVVAILAILGSSKSHVGTLMLIPLLALGVPIFDSILSPIRRFIRGRPMFQADKDHIHHVFLRMGFSSRYSVLLIYGITMALCIMAIFITIFRGKGFEGILFALLLFGMIFLVRKLGYLEYLAFDKFYGWFQDVTDVTGISQKRRSFLSLQIAVNSSQNIDELWESVGEALEMLKFDSAELHYGKELVFHWKINKDSELLKSEHLLSSERGKDYYDSIMRFEIPLLSGAAPAGAGGSFPKRDIPQLAESIQTPAGAGGFLQRGNETPEILGKLILIKDLQRGQLQPYTIRRMESLRYTLVSNLTRLKK